MGREIPDSVRSLVEQQRGILTASQAVSGGITRNVISSRLRQGGWQRMYSGVYAVFSGEPSREAALWAAVLSAGPGAMLSYGSAGELDRLTDASSSVIHITIPDNRRLDRRPGLAIHVSDRAAEARHPVLLPPRTRIEETVLDLAGSARTINHAVGWVTTALGRRLTTQPKLRDSMASRARMRWRPELSELLSDDMTGVLSVLEYRYVRDVERPHGLPHGQRQARSLVAGRSQYRDVTYEAYRLVIELDGRLAHPAETRWQDISRDNAAALQGKTTLRYLWLAVTTDPCQVAAEIAAVLSQRGYDRCRPCRPGCPVGAIGVQLKGA